MTEELERFINSLGKIVASGLNDVNTLNPTAGKQLSQILDSNEGSLRVIIDLQPLNIDVYLTTPKAAPVQLFSLGNDTEIAH